MKKPKISRLAEAYLEELGYLERIKAKELPAESVTKLVERAEVVASHVTEQFESMRKRGDLKEWTTEFKVNRQQAELLSEKFTNWASLRERSKMKLRGRWRDKPDLEPQI